MAAIQNIIVKDLANADVTLVPVEQKTGSVLYRELSSLGYANGRSLLLDTSLPTSTRTSLKVKENIIVPIFRTINTVPTLIGKCFFNFVETRPDGITDAEWDDARTVAANTFVHATIKSAGKYNPPV